MSRRNSGPRLWLRPAERNKAGGVERLAQWYVKDDGGFRKPLGCFEVDVRFLAGAAREEALTSNRAERAKADQGLASYIAAKHRPSVQKGRAATDITVTDVLLLYGEKKVMAKVEELRALDAKAGILHVPKPGARKAEVLAPYEVNAAKAMARLTQLAEWWHGKTLADVDADACEAYLAWRTGQTWKSARPEATGNRARMVSAAGVRRELEDLRAAITWHRGRGYCREVVEVALPSKSRRKEHHLERHQGARLLWGMWRKRGTMTVRSDSKRRAGEKVVSTLRPHRHLVPFTLLGMYTGSRAGAVANAAFEDLPGRSWLDLRTGLFHRLAVGAHVSNKRQPPVRLPDRLLAHIRRWKRLGLSKDYVVEYRGRPITQVNKGFSVALADAGLKGTPHMLRHTTATWLLQRGVPSWDVANFLGVSEKVLLETYGHWKADFQAGIAGGRKKRVLAPPGLHDAFSTNYNRDQDLEIAREHRDARQKARAARPAAAA